MSRYQTKIDIFMMRIFGHSDTHFNFINFSVQILMFYSHCKQLILLHFSHFFIALFSIIFTVVFYGVFQQLFIFYVLLIHLLRSNWAVFEVKWLFVFTFYIFIWFFAWFAKFTCKMRFCVKIFYHKFPLNSKNQPKN